MRKLVKWGRGKYLDCLYGDVAAENEPMKQLAASLGFAGAAPDWRRRPGADGAGAGQLKVAPGHARRH